MGKSLPLPSPEKIDWLAAYEDEDQQKRIAASLITFGAQRLMDAKIIQGLPHLIAIQDHSKKGISTPGSTTQAVLPFVMDWLIDEIRICIFFENYMKAILLFHGAIIHTFRDPKPSTIPIWERKPTKAEQLSAAQAKTPITGSSIKLNGITNELQQNTITMSLMLKPSYQAVIGLPNHIFKIARKYNQRRNMLHLTTDVRIRLDAKVIEELHQLVEFVEHVLKGISSDSAK